MRSLFKKTKETVLARRSAQNLSLPDNLGDQASADSSYVYIPNPSEPLDQGSPQRKPSIANSQQTDAPSTVTDSERPWGLKLLHASQDSTVDIIAIHGLNGHRERTWTTSDGQVLWLQSLLPEAVPTASIWTWGYDSRTHTSSRGDPLTTKMLHNHAQDLVNAIDSERRDNGTFERPIIFVVHSLGGLVLKAALLHSDRLRKGNCEEQRSVKLSTYGIIFLGTPHQGGQGVGVADIILDIANLKSNTSKNLLKHLDLHSEFLLEQSDSFKSIAQDFELVFVYETLPTPILGKTIARVIVPQWSAVVPGIPNTASFGITKAHRNMTKFSDSDDVDFKQISRVIARMAEKAIPKINANWKLERKIQAIEKPSTYKVPFYTKGLPITAQYIDRTLEMEKLEHQILPTIASQERTISVLYGLGGIGKTQLALAFSRKHQNQFSAIFWLNGQTLGHLKRSFLQHAKSLPEGSTPDSIRNLDQQSEEQLDRAVDGVLAWLSREDNKQWLLIYDNVDRDFSSKDPDAFDPIDYMPAADHGSVIVTTRLSKFRDIGEDLEVKRMNANEAEQLVISRFKGLINDKELLQTLIERLGGLPLGLAQAASYMRQTNSSISEYLKLYDSMWKDLNAHETRPQFLDREYDGRSVFTTWSISFNHLRETNQAATNMLQVFSCLDNRDIRYDLFINQQNPSLDSWSDPPDWFRSTVKDPLAFKRTMAQLLDYSLIEAKDDLDAYAVHPVVHEWCYYSLDSESQKAHTLIACISIGFAVPGVDQRDYATRQSRLLPHASRCLSLLTPVPDGSPRTEDPIDLISAFHRLGILYGEQGRLSESETMYERALAGREKLLGRDHRSTLDTVNNLGILYKDQDRPVKAEAMYQRALAGRTKAFGQDHTSTLSTIHNLGLLYKNQGRLAEAEVVYKRAQAGYEKLLGRDHRSTLNTVNNLGSLYKAQDRLAEAEVMYKRALAGKEKLLGPDHTATLNTMHNLGSLYRKQGRLAEAEVMYGRALAGFEKAHKLNHASALNTINNLGNLYKDQGRYDEAEANFKRTLATKEKALGLDHRLTLNTVNNLGNLYALQKRPEAEEWFKRSLAGRGKALGPDHKSTLETINALGDLYLAQGRQAEAETMFKRALAGREKTLGQENRQTLDTVGDLGKLYSAQGRQAEADVMFERVRVARAKLDQPPHPSP